MWLLLGVCSVLVASTIGQEVLPIVTIEQGTVAGSVASDGGHFEFHGIPYADSTSGSHRFKAPLPPPSFDETFVANRRDIKCVRALGVGYEGTEDCLVANIFTPTLDNTQQLPVMVWIKGKEFDKVYEQDYSFRNFVEKDVVIVSLNYRESVLGFLCLGTETAPGNAGLKDIIAGLRWVQENIAEFGGNPNDITLFGHGSGAAAVDLVTLSPLADGLVQKAIAQSGNAFAPWAVTRDNLEYAIRVAEGLGHVITNIEELSNVFARTSAAALMAVINELDLTDNSLAFAPCLERTDLQGEEPFLVKSPYQTFADGDFLQIPFMTGFVDNEGTIRAEEAVEADWLERMESSFVDFIQPDLEFNTEAEETQVAQQIRSFYFGGEAIDITGIDNFIEYNGDTMMLVSTIREARTRAMRSSAATYLYQFSYRGSLGLPVVEPLVLEGAVHSEELAYMFHEQTTTQEVSEMDLVIGNILVERWTNFAKTGVPTSETSLVLWRPFTTINANFLRVLDDSEVGTDVGAALEISVENPHPDTITFWDQIYNQHFLDAVGRWELTDRLEEDDDEIIVDSEESNEPGDGGNAEPDDGGNAEPGDGGNGNGEGNGEGDDEDDIGVDGGEVVDGDSDEDTDNSAATAVGYTFLIVTLFSLLNKFHSSQILS